MSVYNGAKFLGEAIDSILAQTFTEFEFIIIDDASTDDSLKIINSYKDARIIVVKNTKNHGLTKSLNIGIAKAKGKYVARMDADDISMPKRLEKQFDFMEEHPEFAFCGSKAISINEEGQEVKYLPDTVCDKDIILAYIFFKNIKTKRAPNTKVRVFLLLIILFIILMILLLIFLILWVLLLPGFHGLIMEKPQITIGL